MNLMYHSKVCKAKVSMVALFYMKYSVTKERLHKHSPATWSPYLPICLEIRVLLLYVWDALALQRNGLFVDTVLKSWEALQCCPSEENALSYSSLVDDEFIEKRFLCNVDDQWWLLYMLKIFVFLLSYISLQSLGEQEANVLQTRTVTGAIWGRIRNQGREWGEDGAPCWGVLLEPLTSLKKVQP